MAEDVKNQLRVLTKKTGAERAFCLAALYIRQHPYGTRGMFRVNLKNPSNEVLMLDPGETLM